MPIRLSGMQSGLDTEALVSALVMGYRTKKEDYEKHRQSFPGSRISGRVSIQRLQTSIPAHFQVTD